jgi:hypothetical protein
MKPASSQVQRKGSDELECYIHDGSTSFRFEIELEWSWRAASSVVVGAKSRRWNRLLVFALPLIPAMTLFSPAAVNAATLETGTSKAWEEYIESASTRMQQRLTPGQTFLWVDEAPDRLAAVRKGEIVVSAIGEQSPKRVPSGLIHDWIGAAFIPNVSIKDVKEVVRDYARYKEFYRPTVIDSKVISAGEARDRFSMLLANRSLLLKTAFDIDYESCEIHIDDRRGYSITRTTRLQEIEDYGAPAQRVLHEGEGSGVIWRLFGITRYLERDGGVYLELEVIGLSRDIPGSIRWLVTPMVRRISRGSLSATLRQTEDAVRSKVADGNASNGRTIVAATRRGVGTRGLDAPRLSR